MDKGNSAERRPLLGDSPRESSAVGYISLTNDDSKSLFPHVADAENPVVVSTESSRRIEDDVLPETSRMGRTITWPSAYILVISRVIGSGIFATPGTILQSVGSPGLALLLWVLGAVIAACGLAVSLEYGCMLPRSGGMKVYLEFTYRYPRLFASTLIAIQVVFLGFTAGNCIVFSQYALFALGIGDSSDALCKEIAIGLLTFVTVIHVAFPKFGLKLQNGLGWIKIGVVVFMIFSSIYVLALHDRGSSTAFGPDDKVSWDRLWEGSNWNWGVISAALFKVFYSYAGLENVTNVMNEVKNPVRTLRSVSLVALTTACGLYFLINVAYFLVVPIDEIKGSGELIAALFFERLFGQTVGRVILPLAVCLSAAGNVMVVAYALARIKQEIARQGLLPFSDLFSSTKPFNSPLGGYILNYIPSFLVIILPPSAAAYALILEVEGYSAQIFSLAVAAGLLLLRIKRPDLLRPFKAWTTAVWVRIALSVALLASPFVPPEDKSGQSLFYATYAVVAVSIIIVGIIYWALWTIAIPRWKGYELEQRTEVLPDGTSISKLAYRKKSHGKTVEVNDPLRF